jgi:hypothetical protein
VLVPLLAVLLLVLELAASMASSTLRMSCTKQGRQQRARCVLVKHGVWHKTHTPYTAAADDDANGIWKPGQENLLVTSANRHFYARSEVGWSGDANTAQSLTLKA